MYIWNSYTIQSITWKHTPTPMLISTTGHLCSCRIHDTKFRPDSSCCECMFTSRNKEIQMCPRLAVVIVMNKISSRDGLLGGLGSNRLE